MKVTKALACLEDLQLGRGTEDQTRNGEAVTLNKVDIPITVTSIDALKAVDFSKFPRARVYVGHDYTDYSFDQFAIGGIAPTEGVGFWIGSTNTDYPKLTGNTGGLDSAGEGSQYIEMVVNGRTFKILHDGEI